MDINQTQALIHGLLCSHTNEQTVLGNELPYGFTCLPLNKLRRPVNTFYHLGSCFIGFFFFFAAQKNKLNVDGPSKIELRILNLLERFIKRTKQYGNSTCKKLNHSLYIFKVRNFCQKQYWTFKFLVEDRRTKRELEAISRVNLYFPFLFLPYHGWVVIFFSDKKQALFFITLTSTGQIYETSDDMQGKKEGSIYALDFPRYAKPQACKNFIRYNSRQLASPLASFVLWQDFFCGYLKAILVGDRKGNLEHTYCT